MKKLRLLFYILISLWFLTTVSTLTWWFYLILQAPNLSHKMILIEGITLMGLIVFGGLGLFLFNFQYLKSKEQNQQFLLAFTHDLKTNLGTILITLENRERKIQSYAPDLNFNDIKSEILRINTLLENSLLQSKNEKLSFYKEKIDLNQYFQQINLNYEIFKFPHFSSDLIFDKRYFDLIVRNILYNSIHHGDATQIQVQSSIQNDFYNLEFKDNGQGNQAPKIGHTGLGLKLIERLLKFQNGSIAYQNCRSEGFSVQLRFHQ